MIIENFLLLQELAVIGKFQSSDTTWDLKKALVGGLSVVPSINLVAHIGYGPEATQNQFMDDLSTLTPVGLAPAGTEADRRLEDPRLDRWSMLLQLMGTYRAPGLVSARALCAPDYSRDLVNRPAAAPSFRAVSQSAQITCSARTLLAPQALRSNHSKI